MLDKSTRNVYYKRVYGTFTTKEGYTDMMIHEFEQLTGIYPTAELYKVIEKKYMDGPWINKQDFCKAYKANKDGLAESCARCANAVRLADEGLAKHEIDKWKATAEQWKAENERTKKQLDRELCWTPYEYTDRLSDKDYKRLAAQTDTERYTDEQAKEMIAQEFGFSRERIQLQRQIPALEVNKYHQIRKTGQMIQRDPLYNATDWNYAAFEVCGYCYEMVNGELNRV